MSARPLDAAVAALDRAISARPRVDGQAFTDATKAACAYRDALRHAVRETPGDVGARDRLKAANLAVTLLLAGHFPLGEPPWALIEDLRAHLASASQTRPI